jgi:uncharacterized protein YecE (DUF72 family)
VQRGEEEEREDRRERGEEDEQEDREGSRPVALRQARPRRQLLQCEQPPSHGLDLLRVDQLADRLRQLVGDQRPTALRLRDRADRAHDPEAAGAADEDRHEIHDGVDETPGEVAADRPDQHGTHLLVAVAGGADRAGEREHHDQPEEDLGQALDRVQDALHAGDGRK